MGITPCSRPFRLLGQTPSPLLMCIFSLKFFSFPKPKRGSHSYLDISKCSLSFPGQPSKSGLLSLKFKKVVKWVCLHFPDYGLFLSSLFFFSFCALINHGLDFHAPFPSSGNSFVIKFEDLRSLETACSQGLPIFRCQAQRYLLLICSC